MINPAPSWDHRTKTENRATPATPGTRPSAIGPCRARQVDIRLGARDDFALLRLLQSQPARFCPMKLFSGRAPTLTSYDRLVKIVQRAARVPPSADAVAALRATLETLAEILTPLDAARLAAHLPLEFRPCLLAAPDIAPRWSMDEFCHRLRQRQSANSAVTLEQVRCVFQVLVKTTPPLLLRSQLPAEISAWFAADAMEPVASASATR